MKTLWKTGAALAVVASLGGDVTIDKIVTHETQNVRSAETFKDSDSYVVEIHLGDGRIIKTSPKLLEEKIGLLPSTGSLAEQAYTDLMKKFPLIFDAADKAARRGVERILAYGLVTQESGIIPLYQKGIFERGEELSIESKTGARGPFGIMPSTLAEYNKKKASTKFTWDEMFDYQKNAEVFAWNFKKAMEENGNIFYLALWQHNTGAGNIDRLKSKYGTDFSSIYAALDRAVKRGTKKSQRYVEPRNFVGAVLGHARYILGGINAQGIDMQVSHKFMAYLEDTKNFSNIVKRRVSEDLVETPYLRKPFGYEEKMRKLNLAVNFIGGVPVRGVVVENDDSIGRIAARWGTAMKDILRITELPYNGNGHPIVKPGDVVYLPAK
jgi:thymidylate synthase ThyX